MFLMLFLEEIFFGGKIGVAAWDLKSQDQTKKLAQ